MIPTAANSDYPVFVANQVLTSDNLNDLFGYLDEQGRMTRTNLTGMGIVCGLQVKTAADGSSITITKGVGVTSSGYLVSVPEIEYTEFKAFDAVKCIYYDKFVDINAKTQRFNLWELKQDAAEEGTTPLDNTFLAGKIVLIFVELLEENNKNCDPDSCDDKGAKVTVTFRPLLADKNDVDAFLSNQSNSSVNGNAVILPETKMPRYDVESTLLLDTEDVFAAYQNVLTSGFISSVQAALSNAWGKLSSLLGDDYQSDPFSTLNTKFAFLNDGTISDTQVLNLQYFYDFFSDLLFAYDELRIKAYDTVCECLPNETLFPRHLLLGEAIGFNEMNSQYRTRFIASPVLCCCADDTRAVKSLFKKIVLMIDNFSIPGIGVGAFNQKQNEIKITPSVLGREPLSEKAIPFYYNTNSGADPLYLNWNIQRTLHGTASQILSYKSNEYNTTDDFVMNPLKYDIEPNNFLRVEGHIGQDYRTVLSQFDAMKKSNRLPVDIVALSSDTRGIFNIAHALESMDTKGSVTSAFDIMIKNPCCFSDIFLALDEWINKLRCCLLEQRNYYIAQPSFVTKKDNAFAADAFLKETNKEDFVKSSSVDTIGDLYEEKVRTGTINNQFCTDTFVNIATGNAEAGSALVMMPYRIDSMMEVLPKHITELDAVALESKYADLTGTSAQLRTMYASPNIAATMQGVDAKELAYMLEMNCLICLFLEFRLLIREFLLRLLSLMIKQKLGYYAYSNPGIQHKAGVPLGGTFIIVYHEQTELSGNNDGGDFSNNIRGVRMKKSDDSFSSPAEAVKAGGRGGSEFSGSVKHLDTKDRQSSFSYYSDDQPLLSTVLLLDEILFLEQVGEIDDEPNEVLDPIIASLKPGTVIADFYVPYICCSDCAPTQMVVLPPPETPNVPPVAKPGDNVNIELPTNSVTLDGTSSFDPDGTIQTYLWEQQSGPSNATIQNAGSATTLVSNLQLGTYIFKLKVTDNDGATNSDTVTITVTEKPNIPPVAKAETDKPIVTLPDNTTRLIGSNSIDPDGTIVSYQWVLKAGPGTAAIQTPGGPSTNVIFSEEGVYVFTLTVTDNKGATDSADISIFVNEAQNLPPTAKAAANPNVITLSASGAATTQLDSNGSFDPEGGPLRFKWSLQSGATGATIQDPNDAVTTCTFTQTGTYNFTLTVKDDKGAIAIANATVTVNKQDLAVKTCSSLQDIIDEFNNLENVDPVNFKKFTATYNSFKDVQVFYKTMQEKNVPAMSITDQINFFIDQKISSRLTTWIKDLQKLIIDNFTLRLLALTMLQIHAELAYYIACIQKEDVNKAKPPMIEPLQALTDVLNAIAPSVPNFSTEQKAVLSSLLEITQAELQRVFDNNEDAAKPLYVEMLEKIISILTSMPL